mmetsp:Transcript_47878/g.93533  ORF Transcript_47878/g.93533 Transcript_47878/m.93533 type:complete len:363 (+) Transcript_47878:48-1136(+)
MKFSHCLSVFAFALIHHDDAAEAKEGHLSMIGNAYIQHQPDFIENIRLARMMSEKSDSTNLKRGGDGNRDLSFKKGKKSSKMKKSNSNKNPSERPSENIIPSCKPEDVNLSDYPQWQEEKGYWLGEYTLLGGDGSPFTSESWNYPYDHYKGFITGNIAGNSYRQRNVFLYPPQKVEICSSDNTTVGDGVCGINGHSKVFSADQSATTCSDNEELFGDIEGPYQGLNTKTELIGEDSALLYQVLFPASFAGEEGPDRLLQSQLTTLTSTPDGQVLRTRTAQGFAYFGPAQGTPTSASFYRERKVDKEEFYSNFEAAISTYNILVEDLCSNGGGNDGGDFGMDVCGDHLEESFDEGFNNATRST